MGRREQENSLMVFPPLSLPKKVQGIVNYITTGTEHERDMPVFKTMPADEAKVITDHLLKLKKIYEYKNGPQIRQLLIEP